MKNRVSSTVFLLSFSLLVCLSSGRATADETTARLKNPFLLPQTAFYYGTVSSRIKVSGVASSSDLTGKVYGFDLEVNHSPFMNIGAYFRTEALGGGWGTVNRFSSGLGGFSRFFYIPRFLEGKSWTGNIFTRLELGVAPFLSDGSITAGMMAQGGVQVGIETYISKWLGLSASYGWGVDYGKQTLVFNSNGKTTMNVGQMFLVSLKTTFF